MIVRECWSEVCRDLLSGFRDSRLARDLVYLRADSLTGLSLIPEHFFHSKKMSAVLEELRRLWRMLDWYLAGADYQFGVVAAMFCSMPVVDAALFLPPVIFLACRGQRMPAFPAVLDLDFADRAALILVEDEVFPSSSLRRSRRPLVGADDV